MSFDSNEYRGETNETASQTYFRCAVKGCQHADDDELDGCDACGKQVCPLHAAVHNGFVHCAACEEKMKAAMTVAGMELAKLQGKMLDGTISADEAAQCLVDIGNRLSEWDV